MNDQEKQVSSFLEWGIVAQAAPGQDESGDQYIVESFTNGILIGVVDGLGHGPRATAVAKKAVATLEAYTHEPVERLINRCHSVLRGTRGVVMSLASLNINNNSITWLSVGNVRGFLFHPNASLNVKRTSLLLRGGIVGYHLPTPLRPSVVSIKPGDTLVFASDGIQSDFVEGLTFELSPQAIADKVAQEYLEGEDDATVLVARYI